MIPLRPYQEKAIALFGEFLKHENRGVICLPTGTGKTVTGLSLALRHGGRVLWLAHRDELISQPAKTLKALAPHVNPGIVKASKNEYMRDVVFASVQTAQNDKRLQQLGGFSLVVVDEAHHATADSYKKVLRHLGCFSGVPLLGLTATPERTDKKTIAEVFQKIVYSYPLEEAIKSGYLVEPDFVQRKINVDLDKVKKQGGDFNLVSLDNELLNAGIIDEVVSAYHDHCTDKKTIIFTVSVKQAEMLADRLPFARYVSGEMHQQERRKNLQWFHQNKNAVLVNCMVLTEGFDEPSVEAVVMARPTQSKPLYMQCVGRGLRPYPGKTGCLIVDMVGASKAHTLIQAPVLFDFLEKVKKEKSEEDEDTRLPGGDTTQDRLLSVINGLKESRRKMNWVQIKNGFALAAGDGGVVVVTGKGDKYVVDVRGGKGIAQGIEHLTPDGPVSVEFATGIAEDYVRQCTDRRLINPNETWRYKPATVKQREALQKMGVEFDDKLTAGAASDMMTAKRAEYWAFEPATEKQVAAIKRMGLDCEGLTKGQARKLIYDNRRF